MTAESLPDEAAAVRRRVDAAPDPAVGPARALFLNENLGGHATMHLAIRDTIRARPDVRATFLDVPGPGAARRFAAAQVPGLARRDLDLQPLRAQLALSLVARRLLRLAAGTYDVLHVYTQHAALASADILERVPSVVTTDATGDQVAHLLPYREPTAWTDRVRPAGHAVEARVWRAATMVVTKSEWAARSLRERYGVEDDRLRVIPLGIVVPSEPTARIPHELPIVTFVGTTLVRKGGDRLLRIHAERLAGRCELHLVTRAPVEPRPGVVVHDDFVPGDPRLRELFARTDVFAFPTEMDSFGYSAIEAMAAGVPVVACRTSALPEVVQDGVTGTLVDPDDVQLAAAIEHLLDDPVRARAMGEAGRARAKARFDARETTPMLVDVLLEARERFAATRGAAGAR